MYEYLDVEVGSWPVRWRKWDASRGSCVIYPATFYSTGTVKSGLTRYRNRVLCILILAGLWVSDFKHAGRYRDGFSGVESFLRREPIQICFLLVRLKPSNL